VKLTAQPLYANKNKIKKKHHKRKGLGIVNACIPSYMGVRGRRITILG
jgi:hypothetical protein